MPDSMERHDKLVADVRVLRAQLEAVTKVMTGGIVYSSPLEVRIFAMRLRDAMHVARWASEREATMEKE